MGYSATRVVEAVKSGTEFAEGAMDETRPRKLLVPGAGPLGVVELPGVVPRKISSEKIWKAYLLVPDLTERVENTQLVVSVAGMGNTESSNCLGRLGMNYCDRTEPEYMPE